MLALSPQMFSAHGWPNGDEVTSQEPNNYMNYKEPEFFNYNPNINLDNSPPSTIISGDPNVVKKLNHNASERDRRKKINCLYSTLLSLLPDTEHKKKLSIPATVSRALKYVPELQQQVERLAEKKQELISKVTKHVDQFHQDKQEERSVRRSSSTVLASRVGDTEVVVQISAQKLQKYSLSEILLVLEEEGMLLINASSSEFFDGRVFHNLHLQVEKNYMVDFEALGEKLLQLCEKKDVFP